MDLSWGGTMAVGGGYRQWTSNKEDDLLHIHTQAASIASSCKRCVIVGDLNLDVARLTDSSYSRRKFANKHMEAMSVAGFTFVSPSSPTYFSQGLYSKVGNT